jgi:transposase
MARVQVISGVERRRHWSADQKRAIVAAAFAPGAVVAEVTRRADVNSGQIYRWRTEFPAAAGPCREFGFARVMVTADVPTLSPGPVSVIEVAMGNGAHVRIPVSVAPELAAAVLGV